MHRNGLQCCAVISLYRFLEFSGWGIRKAASLYSSVSYLWKCSACWPYWLYCCFSFVVLRGESVVASICLIISVETNGQILSYRPPSLSLSLSPLSPCSQPCFHVAHTVSIVRLLIVAVWSVLLPSRDTSSTTKWILMQFDISMFEDTKMLPYRHILVKTRDQ